MLPIGTAPNVIVFLTGEIYIPQMAKVGLLVSVIGIVPISLIINLLGP